MEKVILTAEQAAAIESIKKRIADPDDGGVWSSVARVIGYKLEDHGFVGDRKAVNKLSDDDFILALTVGYEIKPEPISHVELIAEIKQLKEFVDDRVNYFADRSSHWQEAKYGSYSRVQVRLGQIIEKVGE